MKKFLLPLLALGFVAQVSAYSADTTEQECLREGGSPHKHLSGRVSCHHNHEGHGFFGDYEPFSDEESCLERGGQPYHHWLTGRVSCH